MKLASLKTVSAAHTDAIWSVTWIPATASKQSFLLTGSLDESVKLWKGEELEAERSMVGHSLGVVAVAAHPNGAIAASTSLDSFVRIFDIDSNATIAVLESPPSEAWLMQFDPSGTFLAVAGGSSASVKLWNTSSWRLDSSLSVLKSDSSSKSPSSSAAGKFALAVAYSPDGKQLACSTMDGTVAIFDLSTGKLLHHLEGHNMPVRSLVFSPVEPAVLYTASDDKHVRVYDAKNNSIICAMSGHSSWVLSVDASPDGAALATGSSDRTVRLWDMSMRASVQVISDHSDQVWGVAFRPPGGDGVRAGRLATVSDDKSINLYDYS